MTAYRSLRVASTSCGTATESKSTSVPLSGAIVRTPDAIKIDVDGNELLILAGMAQVLGSDRPPRSVQIEVNHRYEAELDTIMRGHGYRLEDRHHTFIGKRKIAKGADPMSVAHNAVYGRAA